MAINPLASNLEDNYLKEKNFPLINDNFVIISGCSGGGKSSILTELADRGYRVILEPGRQIVKEQSAINGDALPWVNREKFLDLALSRYLLRYNAEGDSDSLLFFDRGIIDALEINRSQPPYFDRAAKNFRYNRLVFLVPPWEEIFTPDAERKHGFEAAKKEFDELLIKYKQYGYQTVLIPRLSVKERVDFILSRVGAKKPPQKEPLPSAERAKRLLDWNRQKLTSHSTLAIDDLEELFAPEFVAIANGRRYEANYQSYFEFLNRFRSTIASIDYQVQEYISCPSAAIMPLKAAVERLNGEVEIFNAILLLKFNDSGKIILWQEVYSQEQ